MKTQRTRHTAALAGFALILAACGGGSDSTSDDSAPPTEVASTDIAASDPSVTDPPATDPPTTEPAAKTVCGVANEVDGEVDGFEEVGCDEPHNAELAGLVAAPTENAPADADEEDALLSGLCATTVQELVSRPLTSLGLLVGHVSTASAGGPYSGDIECWAWVNASDVLTGSIAQSGLTTAFGDHVIIRDVDPGTCLVLADDDSYNLGLVVACTDGDAELFFGSVDADDGEYPGSDAIADQASPGCNGLASDYESSEQVSIDRDSILLTFPDEIGWTVLNERNVLCSVFMSDVDTDAPAITQPDPDVTGLDLVELEPPQGFVFGTGEPVCSIETDASGASTFYEASCDDAHNAELVALVEPPGDLMPADESEAIALFRTVCQTSVETATGADLLRPGIGIAFSVPGELGGAYEGPIECYAKFGSVALVGSFQNVSHGEIIGDQVVIADLDPGECFLFAEDAFSSGYLASCDETDALMAVGTYQAEERPYPGVEQLREERAQRCVVVLQESGLLESGVAGDPSTLSGSFPGENAWIVPGRRLVTCDIAPA